MKKTNSGFSLVELMVVVAIIGILLTISVPNFTKFQAKTKQTNAKTELAGIYTAERAFFSEYSTFHTDLASLGYAPEGFTVAAPTVVLAGVIRVYSTGFSNATAPGGAINVAVPQVPVAPGAFAGFYRASVGGCAAMAVAAPGVAVAAAGIPAGAPTATANTFVAAAEGCPRQSNQAPRDQWAINENKVLANVQSGI